jgi:hypothetical protein
VVVIVSRSVSGSASLSKFAAGKLTVSSRTVVVAPSSSGAGSSTKLSPIGVPVLGSDAPKS